MCCTPTSIRGSGTARSARDGDRHDRRRNAGSPSRRRRPARGGRRSAGCSGTGWRWSVWSSSSCSCSAASSGRCSRRGPTRSRTCRRSLPTATGRSRRCRPTTSSGRTSSGVTCSAGCSTGPGSASRSRSSCRPSSSCIGVPVGAIAGWFGGRTDNFLMRLTDVIYAFPDLLFIILLSVAFRETAVRAGARRAVPRVRGDRPGRLGDGRPA